MNRWIYLAETANALVECDQRLRVVTILNTPRKAPFFCLDLSAAMQLGSRHHLATPQPMRVDLDHHSVELITPAPRAHAGIAIDIPFQAGA